MRQFSNISLPEQIQILRTSSVIRENKTDFLSLKQFTNAIRGMGYHCNPKAVLAALPKAYPNLVVGKTVRGRNGGHLLQWTSPSSEKADEKPLPSCSFSPSEEPTDRGRATIRETIGRIGRKNGCSVEFSLTDFKKEMRSHAENPCNYEECNNGHAKFHLKCVFPTATLTPGPARSGSTLTFRSVREMNDCLEGRHDIDTADCSEYRERIKRTVARSMMEMVESLDGL